MCNLFRIATRIATNSNNYVCPSCSQKLKFRQILTFPPLAAALPPPQTRLKRPPSISFTNRVLSSPFARTPFLFSNLPTPPPSTQLQQQQNRYCSFEDAVPVTREIFIWFVWLFIGREERRSQWSGSRVVAVVVRGQFISFTLYLCWYFEPRMRLWVRQALSLRCQERWRLRVHLAPSVRWWVALPVFLLVRFGRVEVRSYWIFCV